MPLPPGTRLGPYEVLAPIGAGGMGEVYRARDTRLGRDVALKVLPEIFARDAERMARFEREAHVLASLNHPNIAALYGLEESGGTRALVMELVEGETLQGPLPLDEALPLARQIAEALEYAHDRGIVHRDLKPANIKVTPEGRVKVLDFGLAKAFRSEETDPSQSPTMTGLGVVLGTAAYMSPEQARGRRVDKRTDIWAFGCVVFEVLSGERAFGGETVTDTLTAVMGREPDWALLPPATPPAVRLLLERCLRKDPGRRLHDIADGRLELEEADRRVVPVAQPSPRRSPVPWAVAVLMTIAAVIALLALWSAGPAAPVVTRAVITLRPRERLDADLMPALALSPDGTRLVYAAGREGRSQLFLRRLDQFEATPLAGTDGGSGPFFSPDGEWIGFFADGKLKKAALAGGSPQVICPAPNGRGGAWASGGVTVFTPDSGAGVGLSMGRGRRRRASRLDHSRDG